MATLKTMILKNNKRSDNMWNIVIRLTHNRMSRMIPTSMYVSKKDLTSSFKIKNAQILEKCDMLIAEYRKRLNALDLELNDFSIDAIVKQLKRKESGEDVSFTDFVNLWFKKNANKKGLRNYKTSVSSFKRFIGHENISCKELNVKTLKSFETSSKDRPRAQSLYVNSLKTLFAAAREYYNDEDNGIIIVKHSLERYKTVSQNIARKRALTVDEVRSIFSLPYDNVKVRGYSSRHDLALDCFKLSFCLLGMNSADLFNAKDFDGKTITYNRTKTKDRRNDNAIIQVDVHPTIAPLVEKYRDKERVFNFHERFSSMASLNRNINIGLKEIGKEVGIDNLQFYAARHSMATIAVNDVGISKYVVNDMLNHTDQALRVTELYIKKDFKAINEANKKLLEFVFDKNV